MQFFIYRLFLAVYHGTTGNNHDIPDTGEEEMGTKFMNFYRQWLHIMLGCMITAAGLIILKHAHVVTGGLAGLALSLSYLWPINLQYLFILLNIPLFIFSFFKLGLSFTLRTIAAIGLLTAFLAFDSRIPAFSIPSLAGSIIGGIVIGVGICVLFKHGASLGGSSILALYLQNKYKIDPGKTIFVFDFLVLLTCLSTLSLSHGLISIASIVITSGVISLYKGKLKSNPRIGPKNESAATA